MSACLSACLFLCIRRHVSITWKFHTHCEDETQNTDSHTTARNHLKVSNQFSVSFPWQSDCKTTCIKSLRTSPINEKPIQNPHKQWEQEDLIIQQHNQLIGTPKNGHWSRSPRRGAYILFTCQIFTLDSAAVHKAVFHCLPTYPSSTL